MARGNRTLLGQILSTVPGLFLANESIARKSPKTSVSSGVLKPLYTIGIDKQSFFAETPLKQG